MSVAKQASIQFLPSERRGMQTPLPQCCCPYTFRAARTAGFSPGLSFYNHWAPDGAHPDA